jgi:hypothetical protein
MDFIPAQRSAPSISQASASAHTQREQLRQQPGGRWQSPGARAVAGMMARHGLWPTPAAGITAEGEPGDGGGTRALNEVSLPATWLTPAAAARGIGSSNGGLRDAAGLLNPGGSSGPGFPPAGLMRDSGTPSPRTPSTTAADHGHRRAPAIDAGPVQPGARTPAELPAITATLALWPVGGPSHLPAEETGRRGITA